MATNDSSGKSHFRSSCGAPTWMWFWAVLFLVFFFWKTWPFISGQITAWVEYTTNTKAFDDRMIALGGSPTVGSWQFIATSSLSLIEIVPQLSLFLGLIVLATTATRQFLAARRMSFCDSELVAKTTIPEEMASFFADAAPGLKLTPDWERQHPLAYVRPAGWGRACLVLGGSYRLLWKRDREAAQAVALHELAHYRRGDFQVIGIAHFFRAVILFAVVVGGLLLLVNGVASYRSKYREAVDAQWRQDAEFRSSWVESGLDAATFPDRSGEIAKFVRTQFWLWVIGAGSQFFIFLGFLGAGFVLPLAAVWVAEFEADRAVVQQTGRPDTLLRLADELTTTGSRRRRWVSYLTHPPRTLRNWMLRHGNSFTGLLILLLIYPAAYFVRLAFAVVATGTTIGSLQLSNWLTSQPPSEHLHWGLIRNGISEYLAAGTYTVWLPMTILLLAWPWLQPRWERLFVGPRTDADTANKTNYVVYLLAASSTAATALYGAWVQSNAG